MRRLSTWTATWQLIRLHPRSFIAFGSLYLVGFSGRLLPGLIVQRFFDTLTGTAPAGLEPRTLLALLLATELARALVEFLRVPGEETFRCYGWALLRANILANVLQRPGAKPMPVAPGDAIDRLRSDVMELSDWPSWLPYLLGHTLFALGALVIMLAISPLITAAAVLPLVAVVIVVQVGRTRLLRYSSASRGATSAVTAFLGEMFDNVLAVKVADADDHVAARLAALGHVRRGAKVRFSTYGAVLEWAYSNIGDLGLGLALLFAAQAMQAGDGASVFTIGDFALFVIYLQYIVGFPATLGGFLADYQTQALSIERMQGLQPHADPSALVAHRPMHLSGTLPALPSVVRRPADRIAALTASRLTYRYPGSERGVHAISLHLMRGTTTVVTGRVGSGKTTLLRVLLGLLPRDSGEICWNGTLVHDPGAYLVPPRTAYTPQVPFLFSATLRDNIALGLELGEDALWRAIETAAFDRDARELERGLETVVGPRGMRLSGGQVQRAAAARMLARRPELLVLDDLSSALDVDTEAELWQHLDKVLDLTCLVVSHRRPVLRRADRIIVLREGAVEAEGTLSELLSSSQEMQRLWEGDWAPLHEQEKVEDT